MFQVISLLHSPPVVSLFKLSKYLKPFINCALYDKHKQIIVFEQNTPTSKINCSKIHCNHFFSSSTASIIGTGRFTTE